MKPIRIPKKMPSGWLIALGFITFFSALVIVFKRPEKLTWGYIATAIIVTSLVLLFIVALTWLDDKLSPIGQGMRGKAIDTLDPEGRINLKGDIVHGRAIEGMPINPGEEIVVDRIEGKCFLVKRYAPKGDLPRKSKK